MISYRFSSYAAARKIGFGTFFSCRKKKSKTIVHVLSCLKGFSLQDIRRAWNFPKRKKKYQFLFKVCAAFQYYENWFTKLLYEHNSIVRFYDRFRFGYLWLGILCIFEKGKAFPVPKLNIHQFMQTFLL